MMYQMRRRKAEPTILLTQKIFNLTHQIGMEREERCKLYTARKWIAAQLYVIAVTGIRTLALRVTYPALQPTELSPHPENRPN